MSVKRTGPPARRTSWATRILFRFAAIAPAFAWLASVHCGPPTYYNAPFDAPDGSLTDDGAAAAKGGPPVGDVDSPTDGGAAGPPVGACGNCPAGTRCGAANGIPVCRSHSGVPIFTHVFVITMANTSEARLASAKNTPNLAALRRTYATGSAYHSIAEPGLPNAIAITSGGTQGITCDCQASPGGACSASCNRFSQGCNCAHDAPNLGDQLETNHQTWRAFGEGMGVSCGLSDNPDTNYTSHRIPFFYYRDVTGNAARCRSHVVDLLALDTSAAAPTFSYIAPNLAHDMTNPTVAFNYDQNLANGDAFIGPTVATLLDGDAYKSGGLLVIVWSQGDQTAFAKASDPVPIFVISPFAKTAMGGYVSSVAADHYSLLATIEDGLGLPRLGNAASPRPGMAETLIDYFPER